MLRRAGLATLYLVSSVVILLVWAVAARTEWYRTSPTDAAPRRGYHSLLRILDGVGGVPFTYRRMMPDLTVVISHAVPEPAWEKVTSFIRGESPMARPFRLFFDFLNWPPERYPDLMSGYFVIWLGALGYLVALRRLLTLAYDMPAWLSHLAAIVGGVLLAGGSDPRWGSYPYDVPHVFVFTVALTGVLSGAWWTLPAFAVACWSKETTLILIPAYCCLHLARWKDWRCWFMVLAMATLWFVVRQWILWRFDLGDGSAWWYPGRNARVLILQSVFGMWWYVPAALILIRVWLLRGAVPPKTLRVLASMAAVMMGASLFKGWIEERRQYFELLPLVGVLGLRWAMFELGCDRLLATRRWPADEPLDKHGELPS